MLCSHCFKAKAQQGHPIPLDTLQVPASLETPQPDTAKPKPPADPYSYRDAYNRNLNRIDSPYPQARFKRRNRYSDYGDWIESRTQISIGFGYSLAPVQFVKVTAAKTGGFAISLGIAHMLRSTDKVQLIFNFEARHFKRPDTNFYYANHMRHWYRSNSIFSLNAGIRNPIPGNLFYSEITAGIAGVTSDAWYNYNSVNGKARQHYDSYYNKTTASLGFGFGYNRMKYGNGRNKLTGDLAFRILAVLSDHPFSAYTFAASLWIPQFRRKGQGFMMSRFIYMK